MSVISARLGAAQLQAVVGLLRSLCGKGVREEEPDIGEVGLRGLVTACLSRSERKRLSDKRKQQGWLP